MAFLTKPGILALLRNRLHLNDVILSMSSLLVILRDLSACRYMYESVNANFDDMGCTWNAHGIEQFDVTQK